MIHAMIDLETLSTNPNATILTVGGVKFDPYTNAEPSQGMYFRVDVNSQTDMGRDVMQDTVNWWSKQPKEISDEAFGDDNRISLHDMIKKINKFSVGVDVFWCQGPLFDYAILQDIYRQLGYPVPWQYWQIRDSRTLFSLVPRDVNEKRTGLHNALEDCYFQAKKVQKVYKQLGVKNA
jgi:exodeoxyribonuclease VIII|tara:strand:- start:322 stop:855 length:534 start_codon:yes stop_codon:yes gene_type:complete